MKPRHKHSLFYLTMAVLLLGVSCGFFYVASQHKGLKWIVLQTLGMFVGLFVPRMLRAAWTGETWRI